MSVFTSQALKTYSRVKQQAQDDCLKAILYNSKDFDLFRQGKIPHFQVANDGSLVFGSDFNEFASLLKGAVCSGSLSFVSSWTEEFDIELNSVSCLTLHHYNSQF